MTCVIMTQREAGLFDWMKKGLVKWHTYCWIITSRPLNSEILSKIFFWVKLVHWSTVGWQSQWHSYSYSLAQSHYFVVANNIPTKNAEMYLSTNCFKDLTLLNYALHYICCTQKVHGCFQAQGACLSTQTTPPGYTIVMETNNENLRSNSEFLNRWNRIFDNVLQPSSKASNKN